MKGAAQPGAFEAAERQVSAAVSTVSIDQSIPIVGIAKQHEILA
jgi:hypothetical protein